MAEGQVKRGLITVAVLVAVLADVAGAATTQLDEHGTTLIDGQKVFPIVLAKGPERESTTPSGADALDEVVGAGVNFFKVGPASRPWWPEDQADAIAWNQEAAARSVYTWVNLATLADATPETPVKEKRLRDVIGLLRNGPALAMWKGADEPWLGEFAPEELQYAYCVATSRGNPTWCAGRPVADSDHLWVTIQAPRGTAADLAPYSPVTDVHGVDDYPVTWQDRADPALHEVGTWTDTMASVTPNHAVWTTLQICASGSSGPNGQFVLPTRGQERYMIYDAILNGARSLAFYGGNIFRCWNPTDTTYGWNWTFWNDVLKGLIQEINADSPIAPALVNPSSTKTLASTDATTQVISRQGESESDLWVIAARHGPGTEPVTVSGLPATVQNGSVYTEGRSIEVTSGSFTDTFSRWDVHVYRFAVPPPRPPAPPQPPAAPPPPAPPPPVTAAAPARPLALRSARASSARSRRLFTRRVRVVTDTGSPVTTGVVSCGARVRKTLLRVVRKGWRSGSAYCTWRTPRSTRGKTLRGVIRINSQGLSLTHRFTARLE
jgi:hypothetical protein